MSGQNFFTQEVGKWVLLGEHAVLTGATAIVFPQLNYHLDFSFQPQVWEGLSVLPPSQSAGVQRCIEVAFKRVRADLSRIRGTLHVDSTIPIGAGLGSSAALCVAVTRWLGSLGHLQESQYFEFARSLEDQFHGKSSGMDVAAVLAGRPIVYSQDGGAQEFFTGAVPLKNLETVGGLPVRFIDTGLRASTKDCVARVQKLRTEHPEIAKKIDEKMARAAQDVIAALKAMSDPKVNHRADALEEHQDTIVRAVKSGQDCFRQWGLIPAEVATLERQLYEQGAKAVKLTGAGGGGFLVALG